MVKRFLHAYGQSVAVLDRVVMTACALMLVTVVVLTGTEIITRYFFRYTTLYSAEASLVVSALMYFVGYAVLLRRGQDVTLDYLYMKMPLRVQRVLDVLLAIGTLIFFAVLLEASLRYVRLTNMMEHPVLPIPQSYTTAPILIAAICCLWVALYKVLIAIEQLFSQPGEAPQINP
jgi:TRAP-type C4-dicarboxylate transport system permease small subunit